LFNTTYILFSYERVRAEGTEKWEGDERGKEGVLSHFTWRLVLVILPLY